MTISTHPNPPPPPQPSPFSPNIALDDAIVGVRYGVLSYIWGPTFPDGSHFTNTIICSNQALRITANLDILLRRIRQRISPNWPYPPKPLDDFSDTSPVVYPIWIDAICINQHDLVERSSQVRMMPRIYQMAATLLVWLGEVKFDEEVVFRKAIDAAGGVARPVDWEDPFPDETAAHNRATLRMLMMPWFQRRW